jgi:hypothetical protein
MATFVFNEKCIGYNSLYIDVSIETLTSLLVKESVAMETVLTGSSFVMLTCFYGNVDVIITMGDVRLPFDYYSWFARDVIAAMLVSHEQKISH